MKAQVAPKSGVLLGTVASSREKTGGNCAFKGREKSGKRKAKKKMEVGDPISQSRGYLSSHFRSHLLIKPRSRSQRALGERSQDQFKCRNRARGHEHCPDECLL